jgi:putative ABC transport system permease protein
MPRFRLGESVPNATHEVDEEMRFHFDMRVQELMAKGMSREDAEREARTVFGDSATIEHELLVEREGRNRDWLRRLGLAELNSDFRFGWRAVRRNPIFAATVILTFALGIAGAIAGFTIVNGVLLRPLPYPEPSRLTMIWSQAELNGSMVTLPMSIPNFVDVEARARSFSAMAAFRAWPFTLQGRTPDEENLTIQGARVSPALFDVLAVRPFMGRAFSADDARDGAAPVVMIGADLWRRRFASSRDIIGQTITLSGASYTLVGVMPDGFAFPRGAELPGPMQFAPRTELWTPFVFTDRELQQRGTENIAVVGRLAPSVARETADEEVNAVVDQLVQQFPQSFAPRAGADLTAIGAQATASVRKGLWLLLSAVSLVLVIALANIANLMVARAKGRTHELTIRRALGASRLRVLRQLATENAVLAAIGAAIGSVIAVASVRWILRQIPNGLPRADDVVVDWRVVLVAFAATAIAALVFGLASASAGQGEELDVVRAGTRSSGTHRHHMGRRALVVLEIAMSLVLLSGAGLLVRSYIKLVNVPAGFGPAGSMTARVSLPMTGRFDPVRDGPGWMQFFDEYEQRLKSDPTIAVVGAVSALPLAGATEFTTFQLVDPPPPDGTRRPGASYQVVTSGWFDAARVPMLAGRAFDSRDNAQGVPAVVVSRALAERAWPTVPLAEIVGRQINVGVRSVPQTIIGVAGDVHQNSLDQPPGPSMYLVHTQYPYPVFSMVVRARSGNANDVLPAMRRELRALNASLALRDAKPFVNVRNESIARQRFGMVLTSVFAGAALLLAMVGLYGVIATGIVQRTREIGVRVALGASRGSVLATVFREGAWMVSLGVAIGAAGAFATSRVLRGQLFDADATDPTVFIAIVAITTVVALVAMAVPAWRATRIDPIIALRAN